MTKSVCVFCSSSEDLQKGYYDFAERFGKILAENNFTIYHGGGIIGLMGAMMRGAYKQGGAKIIGVVPEKLHREGIVSDEMQDCLAIVCILYRRNAGTGCHQRYEGTQVVPARTRRLVRHYARRFRHNGRNV